MNFLAVNMPLGKYSIFPIKHTVLLNNKSEKQNAKYWDLETCKKSLKSVQELL